MRLLRAYGAEVIVVPTAVPPDHPEYYIQKAQVDRGGDAGRDHGRPALQPREPGGPLPDHRPRDLGADEGEDHALRLLAGHGRHGLRRRPLPQGEEPEGPDRGRRSRGLDLHGVREDAREGRRAPPTRWRGSAETRSRPRSTSTSIDEWITVSRRRRLPDGAAPDARGRASSWGAPQGSTSSPPSRSRARLDDPDALVVTILCDTGERYLSKLYDDDWMRENQMLEPRARDRGQLLERRARELPAARLRGAGRQRPPGPEPHEHLGRLADPGHRRQGLRGLAQRGTAHGARARGRDKLLEQAGLRSDAGAFPGGGRRRSPRPSQHAPLQGDPRRARAARRRSSWGSSIATTCCGRSRASPDARSRGRTERSLIL